MNRDAFASHHRERKTRCFERAIDLLARPMNPSADELSDFVSGLTDEQWQQVVTLANATHDCGVTHDFPSADTQMDVVNAFTHRAVQAVRVQDQLARELEARTQRIGRRLEVVR